MKKYSFIIILPLILLRCDGLSEDLNKWPEHLRLEFLENCIDEKELLLKENCECALDKLESMEVAEGLSYQWIDQIPEETLLKILNNCMNSDIDLDYRLRKDDK